MTSDRKKPGVALWATVVMVVVLAYVLSSGPALQMTARNGTRAANDAFGIVYFPIVWLEEHGPQPIQKMIRSYLRLWPIQDSKPRAP